MQFSPLSASKSFAFAPHLNKGSNSRRIRRELLGTTHSDVRGYPLEAKQDIGYNLDRVQRGLEPSDWKPMVSVGAGVKEIRVHANNEYRVFYIAKFEEAIYVLHSFIKKTEATPLKDIVLGKKRYAELLLLRRTAL